MTWHKISIIMFIMIILSSFFDIPRLITRLTLKGGLLHLFLYSLKNTTHRLLFNVIFLAVGTCREKKGFYRGSFGGAELYHGMSICISICSIIVPSCAKSRLRRTISGVWSKCAWLPPSVLRLDGLHHHSGTNGRIFFLSKSMLSSHLGISRNKR